MGVHPKEVLKQIMQMNQEGGDDEDDEDGYGDEQQQQEDEEDEEAREEQLRLEKERFKREMMGLPPPDNAKKSGVKVHPESNKQVQPSQAPQS